MPEFSKIPTSHTVSIQKTRQGNITIDSGGLSSLSLNPIYIAERRIVIGCRVFHDKRPPALLSQEVEARLYRPKTGIVNPSLEIPYPLNYMHTEVVRKPKNETGPADWEADSVLYNEYVTRYWDLVSGRSQWVNTPADLSEEDIGDVWPGERSIHSYYIPNSAEYEQAMGWPLRVATILDKYEQHLLLLIRIRKYSRTAIKIFRYRVRGVANWGGDIQYGWIPRAIVYDPPGQDMKASLKESEEHGTNISFTQFDMLVEGSSVGSTETIGINWGAAKMQGKVSTKGTSENQITDTTHVSMELTSTQKTIITANNSTAIGRAYWGPLSDLFVILAGPWFKVATIFNDRSDEGLPAFLGLGSTNRSAGTKKLIVPTWALIRPEAEYEVEMIPWDERKKILWLNPFVVKSSEILDEVADGTRPLEDAITYNNSLEGRAVKVLDLYLSKGSEIDYSESTALHITNANITSETYLTQVTNTSGGAINTPFVGGEINIGDTHGIRYGATKEFTQETKVTRTAQFYLRRSQNDQSNGSIQVYYDAIFGTFMFIPWRRLGLVHFPFTATAPYGWNLSGLFEGKTKRRIEGEVIRLLSADGRKILGEVYSDEDGNYEFSNLNLKPGKYIVNGGGNRTEFAITTNMIEKAQPLIVDIIDAKETIRPHELTVRQAFEIFDIHPDKAKDFARALREIGNSKALFKYLGWNKNAIKQFNENYIISWPKPLKKISK